MTRREKARAMYNDKIIELDTLGMLAGDNYSDEIINKAVEREWITEEIANQLR